MTINAMDAPEGWQWLTPEIQALLRAIPGPHEAKKRRTVILLAFAYATSTPLSTVFGRSDTCAEQIWWAKWQHIPEVAEALAACRERALEWADAETVSIEERHRRDRRRAIAEYSAKAPAALAAVMAGFDQKGADRINAAVTLINLADGAAVGPVAGSSDTKIGDKDGGLTIRVLYDDAEHSPAETASGASADTG
jgi:hypothetical protein